MEQPSDHPVHTIHIYNDPNEDLEDDLLPEYDFSSLKAMPNPYAALALRQKAEAKEAEDVQSKEG